MWPVLGKRILSWFDHFSCLRYWYKSKHTRGYWYSNKTNKKQKQKKVRKMQFSWVLECSLYDNVLVSWSRIANIMEDTRNCPSLLCLSVVFRIGPKSDLRPRFVGAGHTYTNLRISPLIRPPHPLSNTNSNHPQDTPQEERGERREREIPISTSTKACLAHVPTPPRSSSSSVAADLMLMLVVATFVMVTVFVWWKVANWF